LFVRNLVPKIAFLAGNGFLERIELCIRGDNRENGLVQKEVTAAVQKRIAERSVLQGGQESLVFEYATNTLLGGRGRGLLIAERLLVFGAPVVRVKVFELPFLSIELRCGGFLGLRHGRRNHHEQEEKNTNGFHYFITAQRETLERN